MRALMIALFVSLPAAAQNMPMPGPACGYTPQHDILLVGALYALVAVLGYWVLTQAVKETSTCIKRVGDVTGSVLVIVGLLGLLCAVAGHVRDAMRNSGSGPTMMAPAQFQPGQPMSPGMGMMPSGQPAAGNEQAPAPKKEKAAKPK
ncbi:MAG: hypothetical protein NTY77_17575 [Elusimicrobia bacterium]|nr:hypothetical protein [Elusimicrobiota bacterium]